MPTASAVSGSDAAVDFGDGSNDVTEEDIVTGGELYFNQTQETITRSKAPDQTTGSSLCTQGLVSGHIHVCEASAELYTK